ncbi:hypothetical protein BV898_13975 [Hypsibius exemplaris]|uniref:DNA-directed RNA polymerase III subunit RPC3 n=1 Tax=Hypsibius exemplaris TaxID=2072580 RepID=A0A1W0W971_HYPEX|nr:hypothetical protein BV898_13975 [Hypsibius exemplaris]
MTDTEIVLVHVIMERHFGVYPAAVSKILLETGEMPLKELYRRTSQHSPRIPSKAVKESLQLFSQHNLLLLHVYPELVEDGPYLSFDVSRAFFFLIEPSMCYAVEELFGDEAARAVALLLGMGTTPAEDFMAEFEQDGKASRSISEKIVFELLRARVFTALDVAMKYDSDDREVGVEMVVRKPQWSKYALQINVSRLFVVFILYLTQSKVENDPALGPVGLEVFLGLCRASLLCAPLRTNFICEDLFLPVTATDVLNNVPENSQEGMETHVVEANLDGIANLIDGFLDNSDKHYTLRGTKLLGMWAEHFVYEILRADLPHVPMARPVMQFLTRNSKPYVQAKALEMELYGNSHAMRYAINDLCRLGFVDTMGTSHVASFEPGRTEIFLHVNLPRLYRQKLQFDYCENVLRCTTAMETRLAKDAAARRFGLASSSSQAAQGAGGDGEVVQQKFEKMEMGFTDALAFSLLYTRAVSSITAEDGCREAFSLVDFFSRNPIPDEQA